ncbi:MAG: NAD(P)-dependent oxidoreductase [Oscillospiraceae bacterium]|nr:NAD(P)-dependent oxidoreductase [Oscillospiraceae bacterium]
MKIVVLEPLGVPEKDLYALAAKLLGPGAELAVYNTRADSAKELAARAAGAEVAVLANQPLPCAVVEQCPGLKLLSVAFTGVDHIPLEVCRKNGVTVCNCAGYSTAAVADLVFGMVLALYRRLLDCDLAVRRGGVRDGLVGFELEGKTFGIVGAGAIGLRTAAIARAFGCRVIAHSRTEKPETGLSYVPLPQLLAQSDIVSLHVPLNESTRGMIGAAELALMKPTALLINTARGPVVDSAALAAALQEGGIAGAGVDVFETEPPISPEHPLFSAPNLIAAPHVAFATQEALQKRAAIAFQNIRCWMDGVPQNLM